tara:strand:- start:190 stop:2607 length:2418 start_codon:yes stop_codon:yes gene_type:complete
MQTRDKKNLIIFCLLNLLLFSLNVNAEEFNISAKEILIDKENEVVIGKGSVVAKDSKGQNVFADKITYEKTKEFLLSEGNVKIVDIEGNIITADKATYDKINEKIITYNNTEIILKEGYNLVSKNILYDNLKKILSSNENSVFTDMDGNIIETTMFQYDIKNNLFSSIGKIKIYDINKNKYFFKEIHIDTEKKEMVGSDISIVLDQKNFGVSEKSDPRFVANDIYKSNNITKLSRGVFTVCQKRAEKCPPWSIKAKKIVHDSIKKNIYYEHAVLKIYDVPIFYFPKFFHPDPTVKRQSGFLFPFFTNSTTTGFGSAIPYYWAMNNDKDLTFAPKFYKNENPLILNEYRQALSNGFFTLDTGFFPGYKNLNKTTKLDGSQSHIFANLDLTLGEDDTYESSLSFKLQRASNDTYFRKHNINTALVDSEDTNLENVIEYNFSKSDMYLNVEATMYENLRIKNNERYEYIFPNIMFGKTFFTEKFGTVDFRTNALHNSYKINRHRTALTNDVIWRPGSTTTKRGFVNSVEGMLRNTNYEARKTGEYKDKGTVNELHGVLGYKTSLPMKKEGINYSNFFSPNFMIRLAPGHMRDISKNSDSLSYANLYSLNKTSEIEDGLSAILGFDFKINEKEDDNEKLSLSLGQVFTNEVNRDIPSKSSLDQKMSDVVGKINYNFSKIGNIGYKFLLDNNLNDLNYNEVSTELNFGKVKFNLDYLEENKHVGTEHYASSGVTLNFNDQNKLNFSTKKNFKTESTEFYNLSYQYAIDCLTAGVLYRREFYHDSEMEPNDTLMFRITFVPFGTVQTPAKN